MTCLGSGEMLLHEPPARANVFSELHNNSYCTNHSAMYVLLYVTITERLLITSLLIGDNPTSLLIGDNPTSLLIADNPTPLLIGDNPTFY